MQAFGVGCIILAFLYALFPSIIISTSLFWKSYLIICISLLAWRALYHLVLEKKLFVREVILVGTGETAEKITEEIEANQESGNLISAYIGASPQFAHGNIPCVRQLSRSMGHPKLSRVERIVVAPGMTGGNHAIMICSAASYRNGLSGCISYY